MNLSFLLNISPDNQFETVYQPPNSKPNQRDNLEFSECLQMTLKGEVLLMVTVKPGAKVSGVINYDKWTNSLAVTVRARAEAGKANNALIHIIAEILELAKQDIEIVNGLRSRRKTIKIINKDIQLIKRALSESLK